MAKIERVLTDDELEAIFAGDIMTKEEYLNLSGAHSRKGINSYIKQKEPISWAAYNAGMGFHNVSLDDDRSFNLQEPLPSKFKSPEGFTEEQLQELFENYTGDNVEPQEFPSSEETATLSR